MKKEKLKKEIIRLTAATAHLEGEQKRLEEDVERISSENIKLRTSEDKLMGENNELIDRTERLDRERRQVERENSALKQVIKSREEDIKRAQNYDWKAVKKRCEEAERLNAEQAETIKRLTVVRMDLTRRYEESLELISSLNENVEDVLENLNDERANVQSHKKHILALQEQNERHLENIRNQTITARAYRDRWLKSLEK